MDSILVEKIKALEATLNEREAEIRILKAVINDIPGSIYWKDKNGIFLGCNNFSMEKLKSQGIHYNSIVGKTNHDLFPKEISEQYERHDLEVINKGTEICIEEKASDSRGNLITQLSYKKPIRDPQGNIIGIMGNTVDITHLKQIENELREEKNKAEAANNAKTEFLQNMRHDIRTPLTGIVCVAELLKEENDKTKVEKFTTGLIKCSTELLHFLNEILESINVSSGEIPLLKKNFNLKETLESVVALHYPVALEKQLILKSHVDQKIPGNLIGDSVRIYRVISELLVNALKFTKTGHVNVFAKLGKKEGQDVVIKIFVEDTGIGISPEKQQDLFVHFKRLTPSYQGIYKGAGLGLSIVKKFLEDIRGEIYVDSQLNKGTKFVCIIPLKEPLLEEAPFKDSAIPV